MEIQNLFFPVKEQQDGKKDVLTEIIAEVTAPQETSEQAMLEYVESFCAQLSEKNDMAEISGEHCNDKQQEAETVREIEKLLSQFAELWRSFGGSSEICLDQLKEMYMLILKQIVQLSGHEEQKVLLSSLELHMLKNLEGYARKNYGSLECFFRQFGTITDRAALLNSFFKLASGRALPLGRISMLLELCDGKSASLGGKLTGYSAKATAGHQMEGILYPKFTADNPESYSKAFSSKRLVEADYLRGLYPASSKNDGTPKQTVEHHLGQRTLFSIQDLKVTEAFMEKFLGEGCLMKNTQFTARNPQIKGFLAAAAWTESNLFLQSSGIQKGLAGSLTQAVDNMVRIYIEAVSGNERPAALTEFPKGFILKGNNKAMAVHHMYHQLKQIFRNEKNPGKALSAGLKYAYEQYRKHEENEGFFFGHPEADKMDCKKGFMLLKKSWNKIVGRLPLTARQKRDLEASFLSPWGSNVSPLIPLYSPELDSPVIIGGAAVIAIIIIFALFT